MRAGADFVCCCGRLLLGRLALLRRRLLLWRRLLLLWFVFAGIELNRLFTQQALLRAAALFVFKQHVLLASRIRALHDEWHADNRLLNIQVLDEVCLAADFLFGQSVLIADLCVGVTAAGHIQRHHMHAAACIVI